jgi:hypothetical protein
MWLAALSKQSYHVSETFSSFLSACAKILFHHNRWQHCALLGSSIDYGIHFIYIDIYPRSSKVKTHSVTTLQQQGLTAKAIRGLFKEIFEGLRPFMLCEKGSSFVNKSVYCPVAPMIYPFKHILNPFAVPCPYKLQSSPLCTSSWHGAKLSTGTTLPLFTYFPYFGKKKAL